jgi:hypothetical protein
VRLEERSQVGVGGGGLAAGQHPHLPGDLRRRDRVGKADLPGDLGQPHLRLRVRVGVDCDDRHGVEPLSQPCGEDLPRHLLVDGLHLLAVRPDPAGELDDPLVERARLADLELEERGPLLGSDREQVSETSIGHQQGARTAPLQQRVGGHRGSQLDRAGRRKPAWRERAGALEDLPDPLHGRGIGGEDLGGVEAPVGRDGDAVGEGAAAVDPELPAHVP